MNPIGYLETGVLFCADNLDRLSEFPDECVDLIYLDPPFFSNRTYEVIWGDEAEVRSFEDRWKGGMTHYIEWMRDRMRQLHRVLKPTGSLYLHCDQAASHYLKVMTDEIFGIGNFRNEIVWRRTGSNSALKRFGPIHQTILYYRRSSAAPFYPQAAPYTRGYVEDYFTEQDERGRYRPVLLTGAGRRTGDSGQPWRGYDPTSSGRHWQPSKYVYEKYTEVTGDDASEYPLINRLDKFDAAGLVHWPRKVGGVPNYKFYLADAPGVYYQDIWAYQPGTEGMVYGREEGIDHDVKWIGARDKERLGYPTQKPEGLLNRIIRSSSQRGDIVLDPFCGCGTTLAVAEQLGRQWIGIDISPTAVNLNVRRLAKLGAEKINTYGLPRTVDDLRKLKELEFQNWVINRVHGTHSPRPVHDYGIDGYSFMEGLPIQVKQQKSVGRPELDKFETALRRYGTHKGYIIAFGFTRGAHDEAARAKREGLEISLVEVGTLIDVPGDVIPRPGLDQMTADLLAGVKAAVTEVWGSRPDRSIEELIASETGGVDDARS